MREIEKLREKTAIFVDTRQVFSLFLACAVVGSGIFVAGVWVGKRMSVPSAPDLQEDPLAAIDQMGNEEEALSFEQGLNRRLAPSAAKTGDRPALATASVLPPVGTAPESAPQPRDESNDLAVAAKPTMSATKRPAGDATVATPLSVTEAGPSAKPVNTITSQSAPMAAPNAAAPPAATSTTGTSSTSAVSTSPPSPPPAATAPAGAATPSAASSGTFTLQLSSFQSQAEADEYSRALAEKGYQSYVISSEVPGKGLWYRVRMGDYPTQKDALEAKSEFERKNHVIAYVSKR